MATIEQLEIRLSNLEKKTQGIITSLERVLAELISKASSTDLGRLDAQLRELITANNSVISQMEQKLSKISLPEDTRHYLEGSEVQSFQSNFNQLKAMMIQFDKLYKNLVAYEAKRTN